MKRGIYISHSDKDHLELNEVLIQLVDAERISRIAEKRSFYKRVLARLDSKLRSFRVFAVEDDTYVCPNGLYSELYNEMQEFGWLNEKRDILERLISIANRIIHNYEEKDENRFVRIEKQLEKYLDEYDKRLEWEYASYYIPSGDDYVVLKALDEVRTLRTRVRYIKNKIYRKSVRDIRQLIRNVIQLMFRSSDDDADVANVLVQSVGEDSLVTLLKHRQYGKERNFRAAIRA
ncbi:MAG: hypothetical protein ACJ748_01950 [Flavisolibacter sp.]